MKQKLLVFFIASVILFSSAMPALAETSLADQIQAIKNQISLLQSQLAQLQSGQNQSSCHTFNINLGFANSGSDEVTALHNALSKEGISVGNDSDTIYAEDTAAAVVLFQAKYGIRQTGYTGPLTRAKLNALYGCSVNSSSVNSLPPTTTNLPSAISSPNTLNTSSNISETRNPIPTYNKSALPIISYITPGSGAPGDTIVVRGANFTSASTIKLQKDGVTYLVLSNVFVNDTTLQMKIDNSFLASLSTGIMYRLVATNANGDSNSAGFTLNAPAPTTTAPVNSLTCSGSTFSNLDYYTRSTTTNSNGDSFTDYCVTGSTSYNLMKGYCGSDGKVLNMAYLCVSGCKEGACLKQATYAPVINIIAPKGGEQWQKGTRHIINWQAYEVNKVNIAIGDLVIANNVDATPGSFAWTVPTTMTSGLYEITIYDANNPSSVVATSKTISILSSVWQ